LATARLYQFLLLILIEKQQVTDRDKAVMTVMRELQEVKQIVAASNEKKWYHFLFYVDHM